MISLFTVIPDLFGLIKFRNMWNPVPVLSKSYSDNYHYFSMLNQFHLRFLNFFYKKNYSYEPFSSAGFFLLTGYLINVVPYHLGYVLKDKRLGVVFVRVWNRYLLGISTCFF